MPTATAPGLILDRFGNPAGPGRGALYRQSREDREKREQAPNLFNDYLALLDPRRYLELVSRCRHLGSRGLVESLNESKADYVSASGFLPTFLGEDEVYGNELLDALIPALNTGNLRGSRFDWRSTWRLGSITRATDGSYYVLLTRRPDTGWPAYQVFEGHRIWQRDLGQGIVGADDALTVLQDGTTRRGVYRGLKINQGIITTDAGTEVAYRVLGADPDGRDDQDISARDMIHVARPKRHSEGRPPPQMAGAGEDFIALLMATTAQLDQQIMHSRRTVVESNASGKAPYQPGASFGEPGPEPVKTEEYTRGSTLFIKSGFEAKPWEAKVPSDQWMNFDQRVSHRAATTCRWRLEMLDPGSIGSGANNRAFEDQINTLIQDEFTIDAPAAARVMGYFASVLADLGVIENHLETRAIGVAPPPYFQVDRNSARIDLEEVAAGRRAMSELHGRDGHTPTRIYRARVSAYKQARVIAEKEKVPLEIVLGDLGFTAARTGFYPIQDPIPDPTAPQPTQAPAGAKPPQQKAA